ncbi:MAG: dienelactone hydrolase family protein [Proteobacteria bacterium]|nr:dienelactone hydrolase family protein [Pseudomonadota bacterium]
MTPILATAALAETVHFQSASTAPTALQQRLARERGTPVAPQPTTELIGELYRPPGSGPFPAVVALHGCAGRGSRAYEDATAARFTSEGYALLFVDSFKPRGIADRCNDAASDATVDRVMDAYGGLIYLSGLPFINPSRIALAGYSQGAIVALSIVAADGINTLFDRHFKAAIAYYPLCDSSRGDVSIPTLVLIGALDDWTPAASCQAMMARRTGEGAPLRLVVYPGAYHSFDAATLRSQPRTYKGHHLEYNEAADRAAWSEASAFLHRAFSR